MKSLVLVLALTLLMVGTAFAVPAGKTLEFTDSSMGTVTFSGQIHKDAGLGCKDCHNKDTFPKMKKGTVKITMAQINAGTLCGACHNGKRAFEPKNNCGRCHKK